MANLKFTKSHEWAKIEDNYATIGITDYAQHELGDIVFVELPAVGKKITKAGQFGVIESTKAASELYSPLTGDVVEVNSQLLNDPGLVNKEPLVKGWMIKIKITNSNEIKELMDESQYQNLLASQSH